MLPLELPKMTRKNATVWPVREFMSAWRRFRLCMCACVCVKEIKGDDEMRMELSPPRPAVCSFYTSFRRDPLAEQSRTRCGSIRPPNPTPPPLAPPPSRNGDKLEC